jgi:hypothetical protein
LQSAVVDVWNPILGSKPAIHAHRLGLWVPGSRLSAEPWNDEAFKTNVFPDNLLFFPEQGIVEGINLNFD